MSQSSVASLLSRWKNEARHTSSLYLDYNFYQHQDLCLQMSCEDCSHFLEIAEAMRNLGLTILKGATEAHGDKTWICFVVEV